jgi:hypothetical protein
MSVCVFVILQCVGPEPVAIMEHPSGVNINFILNASPDSSLKNLLMDEPKKHTGYTHIALEISDAESVEHQLDAAGIEITEKVLSSGRVATISWNQIERPVYVRKQKSA